MLAGRHADIAYVLEGVAGVRRAYLLTPRIADRDAYDLAVEIDHLRFIPAAHYALLRILSNRECGRVLYRYPPHSINLPPGITRSASSLQLTMRDRDEARIRVVASSLANEPIAAAVRRHLRVPKDGPFRALLVDVDDEVHDSLRWIVRGEAKHLMLRDQKSALDVAFAEPFHVIVCGAAAALAVHGFLSTIAREDPDSAARIVVVGPARDVPYLKWNLERWKRSNPVIASPIDDTILRHEAFRDHAALFAQLAAAEVADGACIRRPRFRNLQVLLIDEDNSTEILLAANEDRRSHEKADVMLAKNAMAAFEHAVSREIDLVLCSTSLRGDSGEPFYRVLWRMKPALKSRTVLIAPRDAIPPSRSTSSRIVERPLTRTTIARVIDDLTSP